MEWDHLFPFHLIPTVLNNLSKGIFLQYAQICTFIRPDIIHYFISRVCFSQQCFEEYQFQKWYLIHLLSIGLNILMTLFWIRWIWFIGLTWQLKNYLFVVILTIKSIILKKETTFTRRIQIHLLQIVARLSIILTFILN